MGIVEKENYKGYKITIEEGHGCIITKIFNKINKKEMIFENWTKTKEEGLFMAKDWLDNPNKIIR